MMALLMFDAKLPPYGTYTSPLEIGLMVSLRVYTEKTSRIVSVASAKHRVYEIIIAEIALNT
jgi:hypothetical protein